MHNFKGQHLNCPHCGKEKAYSTTGITSGVSEDQLNQVYNLMDVYCHPFTSGGQEIPIQEAKLTELVTLVTNYSCGEDNCTPDSASLALDWSQYREHNTEFIKASTTPQSIADQLSKAFKMSNEEKEAMGKKARQWVIDNFATEVIGKQIEAARVALTRYMKRTGKVWTRIFPNIPVSKKPTEVRMGKGKGSPEYYACRVKPGRIIFEIDGVSEEIAREALYKASAKLPIKTKFVKR